MILVSDSKAQYEAIKPEIDGAIQRVLDSGWFVLGKEVVAFEAEFATWNDNKYAVGVGNGTDAIALALRAVGIGPGDEVITTTHTATFGVLGISMAGATPVLCDINPATGNIDPSQIVARITSRTKAIMPVHLYGAPAEMEPILAIADQHGLVVVEDCAQAHGAEYKGRKVGTLGRIAAFSFYPSKNLGAFGDGGLVATDDRALADMVTALRNGGQEGRYNHVYKGVNSRLDELHAAMLRVKLAHLDEWNRRRGELACYYHGKLEGIPGLTLLPGPLGGKSVYHLYVVKVEEGRRAALQEHLTKRGVATTIHYPTPVHLQPAYRDLEQGVGSFPHAEAFAQACLSLPLYPEMTQAQQDTVVAAVREFFS